MNVKLNVEANAELGECGVRMSSVWHFKKSGHLSYGQV